jgi:hypothetical protein
MRPSFRFCTDYRVKVELAVRLDHEPGRLEELVQVLHRSDALITDLSPDRSHTSLELGEGTTRVKFLVRSLRQRDQVFEKIRSHEFRFEVASET